MVSSTRQAIACIFAIIVVAVAANAQTTPVKEPGATISGKVTIKGQGAPGVTVALRPGGERQMSGRQYSGPRGVTDIEGNYRITNVPPGSYRVLTAAKAYVPVDEADREKLLIVNKGDTIENIDFALIRGAVITGRVVDAEGRPVVEEYVSVFTADNKSVYIIQNTSTDDRGVYRIYGLRGGSYKVSAGRGEQSFPGGRPAPYKQTYHPSVSDMSQATVVEVSEGGEVRDVDITFTRTLSTYTVRGRIIDGETGQPLPNVEYSITRLEENGSSTHGGYVTNSRGEFKVENLSPGKYSLPVSGTSESDLRYEETPFEIIDQDINGVIIKGTRGGSISGVVVFEGLDAKAREQLGRSYIMAAVEGAGGRSRNPSTMIRDDGSFQLRGVGGGAVTFYLHSQRHIQIERIERDGVPQPRRMVIQEREHIKGLRVIVQIGNATLRGKIDVENGTLPADARFFVWARIVGEDPAMRFSGSNLRPQVDARGQFVVEGLMGGTYEVDAGVFLPSAKLNYTKRQQVVITPGATTTVNITVDLNSTPIKQ